MSNLENELLRKVKIVISDLPSHELINIYIHALWLLLYSKVKKYHWLGRQEESEF